LRQRCCGGSANRERRVAFPNLFIVSYGRTGSTVLTGIVNAIPGYIIRGENADLTGHLMAIADDLRPHATRRPTKPTEPWFGGEFYTDAMLDGAFRQFVDRILLGPAPPAGVRCYGFKEVRYTVDTVEAKVAFLERLFPGAGFLYSVRDSKRVARSEFQNGVEVDYFEAAREKFANLAERPNGFLVSHDELVTDPDGLLPRLFAFLDEPYNAPAIKALLATQHGYSRPRPDAFLTDFPFYVRAGVRPRGIEMLYINRFERGSAAVVVGGFVGASLPGFSPAALRERSGRRLMRFERKETTMRRQSDGAEAPVTNFIMELECPASVDHLEILLPAGDTLFELHNLRHLGRDLGRRA
jgi:hypothetical protein